MGLNNKIRGTNFERQMCHILADKGYWVHFITPDTRGAQPFDIVAVRGGKALAIDCKTSSTNRFSFNRLEDNQVFAFERWLACGNNEPLVAVLYQECIYMLEYTDLKEQKVIDLRRIEAWINS